MRLGKYTSSTCTISTGAPQSCVLSSLLFYLYTNYCASKDPSVELLKFADDTTLVGIIQDGDESAYRQEDKSWLFGAVLTTFSFTTPGRWNELPTPIRNAGSLKMFERHLKTHLFCLHLTPAPYSSLKKNFFSFLNLSLSEQCLKCCMTSTSCDFLPLYNVSLTVFLNCRVLWIKASVKLINVNVTTWS